LADKRYVDGELRKKGVTRELWHEYKATYPETGYSYAQFSRHYRGWKARLDLPMRQEHRAGETPFVDFPGQRLPIWDRRSGALAFEAELFVGEIVRRPGRGAASGSVWMVQEPSLRKLEAVA
jgi:transposase